MGGKAMPPLRVMFCTPEMIQDCCRGVQLIRGLLQGTRGTACKLGEKAKVAGLRVAPPPGGSERCRPCRYHGPGAAGTVHSC